MDLIDSTATMAWNNSSLLTSSQHHRCTYDDEGSQNYLFAVGGGLGIATPIKYALCLPWIKWLCANVYPPETSS